MHTLELNAGTVDTDAGPHLRAGWTWAPSVLDHEQVNRLSRLWFDALAGICAHVRSGGGGLTPSDIAPACLSQRQIDDLASEYPIADILPLTPLQQGLLFHANTGQHNPDDVYAVQLDITLSGRLDPHRLREAVHTIAARHPNLVARFRTDLGAPVRIVPADPEIPWSEIELDDEHTDFGEQVALVCAAERAAVFDLAHQPAFRVALIRTAQDQHRFVLTTHHILLDGWSLSILLNEIFAGYYERRLPAAVPYRRFLTWLAERDVAAARAVWREELAGFHTPTLVAAPDLSGLGRRDVASFQISEETTRALDELARSCQTTVSAVLQAAWAQLLVWLTGQHDVAFGAVVSGRQAELPGMDSMVGLLINTIPVRVKISEATTATDLLDQLQNGYTDTLEHQHLALSDIHRLAGLPRLFDTVFVYENYPADAAGLSGAEGLAITGVATRDFYHYPLTVQAVPGRELDVRVQFRADVFDATGIEALVQRFKEILVAMIADPARPLSSTGLWEGGRHTASVEATSAPQRDTQRTPTTAVERTIAEVYARVLQVDHVGVDESFFDIGGDSLSAVRAVAEINTVLGCHLTLSNLLDAPSVAGLSQRWGRDR